MTKELESKRGRGSKLPPLDVTAPQRWTRRERVQFIVRALGGPAEAARRLDVSERTVARYQAGETDPPPDVAEQMCLLAGVRPGYIDEGGHFAVTDSSSVQVTFTIPAATLEAAIAALASKMTPDLRRALAEALLKIDQAGTITAE